MPKTKPTKLTDVDVAALERAVETVRQRSEADGEQVDDLVKRRGWREAAEFCSYSRQCETLWLRPWQWPPCEVEISDADIPGEDWDGRRAAAQLLEQLLELGLSKFESSPLNAIAAAERATKLRNGSAVLCP
jgi:hypothetical protein